MKSGHLTLRKKMLLALLASFLPMLLAITLLFDRSIRVQHRAHVQAISYTAQDISKALNRFTEGVYSVSDAFSTDERLLEILDRSYSDNPNAKKYAITYANGALFESYSRLVKQKKIDAIYVVNHHDVLDFLDPNQTTTLLIKNFEALGMDDARKFGKFYFYPLQENFLRTERYGEVRRDQVVLGSRRCGCCCAGSGRLRRLFQQLYRSQRTGLPPLPQAPHILNTMWALILPAAVDVYFVFLLRQAFVAVPDALSEAARIDGCSHFTIYRRIILPLCMPQVSTMLLFSFVWSWNDYMGPYLYISDINKQMISVGIKLFASGLSQDYGAQMAGATLVLVPVIIAFFLCQKYFVEGITAGAVKG